jgi:CRP-like cAMP-binding protein
MHDNISLLGTSPQKSNEAFRPEFELFFGSDPALLGRIEAAAAIRNIPSKTMILSQDDTGNDIYYLLKGRAHAALMSSDGHEIWLDGFSGGTIFGEMAAFGLNERSASVYSSTKVTVASFSAETFKAIMAEFGTLGIKMAQVLTSRVKHTTMRMYELSAMSANGRVYAELLRMAQSSNSPQTLTIDKMPHKTRIAQKIHSTRETVSRAISDLQHRGIVKVDGKKIQIIAPERLKELLL